MTTETPRYRFERVILPRVEKAVKAIELIGNGASRDYETTPEEIAELLNGLQQKLWEVQRRYAKRLDCGTEIFDAVEGGEADVRPIGVALGDVLTDAKAAPAEPALDEDGVLQLTAAVAALRHGHVPMLVAAVPERLLPSVITQLVHRAMELVETKGGTA